MPSLASTGGGGVGACAVRPGIDQPGSVATYRGCRLASLPALPAPTYLSAPGHTDRLPARALGAGSGECEVGTGEACRDDPLPCTLVGRHAQEQTVSWILWTDTHPTRRTLPSMPATTGSHRAVAASRPSAGSSTAHDVGTPAGPGTGWFWPSPPFWRSPREPAMRTPSRVPPSLPVASTSTGGPRARPLFSLTRVPPSGGIAVAIRAVDRVELPGAMGHICKKLLLRPGHGIAPCHRIPPV